jgi:glucose dehydrogenase
MPRDQQVLIYAGIKSSVVALDARSGAEVWRADLHGSDYVTVRVTVFETPSKERL